MLDDVITSQLSELFSELDQPVDVVYFGSQNQNCQFCSETQQLLEEVIGLTEKIKLHVHEIDDDRALAEKYAIDKVPGFIVAGRDGDNILDHGIRFYGIPSGHEFSTLITDMMMISKGDSGLSADGRAFLAGLKQPVHLQVYVTPTCPYCPQAVVLAHRMAFESEMVVSEMIEATEFPILTSQYQIGGVPDTVINYGAERALGAVPEAVLIEKIRGALE
jgi:glutaredoxin-like protein